MANSWLLWPIVQEHKAVSVRAEKVRTVEEVESLVGKEPRAEYRLTLGKIQTPIMIQTVGSLPQLILLRVTEKDAKTLPTHPIASVTSAISKGKG